MTHPGESVAIEPGKPRAGHFIAFIPEAVGVGATDETMLEEAPCRLLVQPDREGGNAIVRLDIGPEGESVILARLDDVEAALAQAKGAAEREAWDELSATEKDEAMGDI